MNNDNIATLVRTKPTYILYTKSKLRRVIE